MIQLANFEERTFYVMLGKVVTSVDVTFTFQMTEEEFTATLTPVSSSLRATKFTFQATGYPEGQYIVKFVETGQTTVLSTVAGFVSGNPIFATSQYNTYNDDGTSTTYVPSDDQGLVPSVSQKLRVSTVNQSTDVSYVRYIKVTNGTLTDNGDNSVTIATGGAESLTDLGDVLITGFPANQILRFDAIAAKWKNVVLSLDALSDTKGTPVEGKYLKYTGGFWQPADVAATLGQLTDVDTTGQVTGYVLVSNGTNWSAQSLPIINGVNTTRSLVPSSGITKIDLNPNISLTSVTANSFKATGDMIIQIDSDNNQSGRTLTIVDGASNERFKVDESGNVTINGAYKLPLADGSANQLLKTDGADTLSFGANLQDLDNVAALTPAAGQVLTWAAASQEWQPASPASPPPSLWTASGNDIYYTTGNVGVGTTTPSQPLDVDGNIKSSGYLYFGGSVNSVKTVSNGGIHIGQSTGTGLANAGVVIGTNAGRFNSGQYNTALGAEAGYRGSYSPFQVAIGYSSNSGGAAYSKTSAIGIGSYSNYNGSNYTVSVGAGTGSSSPSSYTNSAFFGHAAGNSGGNNSVFVGYQAGKSDGVQTVDNTVAVGYQALTALTTGANNTAVGYQAGAALTASSSNTFFGYQAGYQSSHTSANDNTFIGYNAGSSLTTGAYAGIVAVGSGAGNNPNTRSVHIGNNAGINNNGFGAVNIGFQSGGYASKANSVSIGYQAKTGANSVSLGYQAGENTGSGNIFIGYQAGDAETGSNKLYIENSNSTTPLIYGEFDNDLLRINGDLEVTGTVSGSKVITITAATTLSASHVNRYVLVDSASAINITVPASATYDDYAEFIFEQTGAGQITVVADTGVTINSTETLKSAAQYAVIGLKRTATNTYTLTGERELV